jgi:hypothetical protein
MWLRGRQEAVDCGLDIINDGEVQSQFSRYARRRLGFIERK